MRNAGTHLFPTEAADSLPCATPAAGALSSVTSSVGALSSVSPFPSFQSQRPDWFSPVKNKQINYALQTPHMTSSNFYHGMPYAHHGLGQGQHASSLYQGLI